MGLKDRRQTRERSAAVARGRRLVLAGDDQAAQLRLLLASVFAESRPYEVAWQAAKAAELGVDYPVIQVRAGSFLRLR